MSNFDYIIIGAGAAGLLLADALGNDDFFSSSSILIIDQDNKTKNDRTWCFWESGNGKFDHLLHKSWPIIHFAGKELNRSSPIAPYRYKMLRGIDFYDHYVEKIKKNPNVTWVKDRVIMVEENGKKVLVTCQNGFFSGRMAFDSRFNPEPVRKQQKYPLLQQHFMGWFIKTEKPVFNPEEATFMDFSIPQKGNTRFMYVLPFSQTEALLEYTLFSENLLEKSEYENGIQDYMEQNFGRIAFEITDVEQGTIPMTCYGFHKHNSNRIVHIGVAGGWAKPSTGFTFYNTSKRVTTLVDHLKKNKPFTEFYKKGRFWFYDLLLLDILHRQNHLGQSIFESMFKKRKPQLILKFLDEETSLWEDLKIISACPKMPFIKALFQRMFL
ncbi:lycopene cyclase family protein [Flagellimonas sp.]|uniref:lycopene cyclase family protein n=1 Tax=Flagellimonas sp. TaxID=2058762 RepID=UPI003B5AF3F6